MELDNLALESVMDARRKAVQTSIRQISTEELNSLVTEILFEDPAHPWCEIFRQFIKDNASAVFYQASTTEHIQLVYCRARELGIWFVPGAGLGLLGTPGTERDEGDRRLPDAFSKSEWTSID